MQCLCQPRIALIFKACRPSRRKPAGQILTGRLIFYRLFLDRIVGRPGLPVSLRRAP
jgi:hypothetical protein